MLELQRTAGNQATVQFLEEAEGDSPVLDVVGKGGGAPMDKALRSQMESSLGHDFGDVRVHTDHAASESAKAVGAQAYTVGNDIVFGSGKYDPGSSAGQKTIAHELTHVVQQKAGPVDGTPAPGGSGSATPATASSRRPSPPPSTRCSGRRRPRRRRWRRNDGRQ